MNIEIKVDPELLAVLLGIKEGLGKLSQSSEQTFKGEPAKPMTLDEFVADPDPQTYTLKDVRAKLATLEAKKAKALITSYGVDKLTALPEVNYADIMQKAGEV